MLAGSSVSRLGVVVVLLASVVGCTASEIDARQSIGGELAVAGAPGVHYQLVPGNAVVGAGTALRLEVQRCAPRDDSSEEGIELTLGPADTEEGVALTPLVPDCVPLADASLLRDWSVNGSAGGSPLSGTITAAGTTATYTAPREIPGTNPVAVSVEVLRPGSEKMLLVSHLTVVRPCPVPVCRFEGTAWEEVVFGRGEPGSEFRVRGDATVTWTFSRMDGREALYVASGRVGAQWTNDHCTITLSPSAHTFDASSKAGGLGVDFSTDPVTYSGSGFVKWDASQHWSCTPGTPWSDPEGGAHAGWFWGGGAAGRDGTVLQGTRETEDRRGGWGVWAGR